MKKIIIPSVLILLAFTTLANRYSFDQIPSNLKHRADAVIRTEQMTIEIIDVSKATIKFKRAITLINDNASSYRYASIHYNPFFKIKKIKASVYDEKGKIVEVIGSSDILDMSAVSGVAFYSEHRQKVIFFPKMKYPYTVEYEYEGILTSLINYPEWNFQHDQDISVEKSGIQYIVPKNLKVKFKELNLNAKVDSVSLEDKTILTWQEENIPTLKANEYGIPFSRRSPSLLAAPYEFDFGGYAGSLESWKSFGNWNNKIIEGRDIISPEEAEKVRNLVKDIPSEREKIKAIYEYMQGKTRYVAISLGIGGLQPFEAKYVSEKGFGDCKALSNYTMALLKVVGIKSYYTLVKSGENENINPNFVSNQFDHVILCVPQPNDTVWLECTNQTAPFNYLGDFTSDRYVLLTTEEGGKLVKTPSFKKGENSIKLTGTVKIDYLGNLTTASFQREYSGMYYGVSEQIFVNESESEIKRYLNEKLNFATFSVTKVNFEENKSEKPTSTLKYDVEIRDFCSKSSNRLYFNPSVNKLSHIQNEKFAIQISNSNSYFDSIIYKIPAGYTVEFIPENIALENNFGKYSYTTSVEGDKITFNRQVEINKGNFEIEKFDEFYSFINSIATKDREFVILKKI